MSQISPAGPVRPRATIRDVAALAGVGIKTVSRVVNHEPNVSAETRSRVERAIAALNFHPNLGAGALRRANRKTRTVGLLLDAVDNPFSAAINRAVESVAVQRGFAVFAASSEDDPERERQLVATFTQRRVDGLILTTITPDQGYLQSEREQGTPLVFVDRSPVGLLADAVVVDNVGAARGATQHLLAHGHRRVAYLGDDLAIMTARERLRGYDEAIAAAGLPADQELRIPCLRSASEAYEAVLRLLDLPEPPTGLFTAQNLITIGALRALHERGRQHRVALVGFDDLVLADLLEPAVSVVVQDAARIGQLAAGQLFARMDGDDSPTRQIVVPSTLVPRGSGEIAPPSP